MIILAAVKSRLLTSPTILSKAKGGIFIGNAGQASARPHILLEMPESGQDYTHDGPVGLIDAHVVMSCRADVDYEAEELGVAADAMLKSWVGTAAGCNVQLAALFNVHLDYDADAKAFSRVSEYTVFYRRTA